MFDYFTVRKFTTLISLVLLLAACGGPRPGPDKQFGMGLQGAVSGAGSGAVTGFQLGSGTGPGAAVGAGLGFVAGGIRGFAQDRMEENLLKLAAETQQQRKVALAHEILEDHYRRRIELHPTRDIYPADLFFYGDEAKLRPGSKTLVSELAKMNKERLAWSRIAVVAYTKTADKNSDYAKVLSERRARALSDALIRAGIEPRRISARAVMIDAPLLIDPDDAPGRYNQAMELVPLDR